MLSYSDGTMEFWERIPTGDEFKLQTIMAVNHGAVGGSGFAMQFHIMLCIVCSRGRRCCCAGIMPWDAPTTNDITQAAREIAPVFSGTLAPWVLDASTTRMSLSAHVNQSKVDVAAWIRPSANTSGAYEALVLAANMNYDPVVAHLDLAGAQLALDPASSAVQALFGNATIGDSGGLVLQMNPTGISGHVLSLSSAPVSTANSNSSTTSHGPQGKSRSAGLRMCDNFFTSILTRACWSSWHIGATLVAVAAGWAWQSL
jgi:hypothetical protein